MKIIAIMEGRKYLVEVEYSELRELNSEIQVEVGAEYEILKAAQTLSSLRSISRNKMKFIKKQIDELQTSYNQISDSYDEMMLLDTIKNSEEKDG
jgi:hypothetical protein